MDFSHYIMKSSQYIIQMLKYITRTMQHIIKCEQVIMMMVNQMFLFLTIRQLWRSIPGYTYFFLFLLQIIDCGYSLEPPQNFSAGNFQFLKLKKSLFITDHYMGKFSL